MQNDHTPKNAYETCKSTTFSICRMNDIQYARHDASNRSRLSSRTCDPRIMPVKVEGMSSDILRLR